MTAMVRTFVAIETTPVEAALTSVQSQLRSTGGGKAVRWTDAESIHLTLKFLGDVPGGNLGDIYQAVDDACQNTPAFEVDLHGIGCFPNLRRPRVVWVGVRENAHSLETLQRSVEGALEQIGYPPEKRPFHPHLTLGRVKRRAAAGDLAALSSAISGSRVGHVASLRVNHIVVMKSDLRPQGALYTELYRTVLFDRHSQA